MTLEVTNRTGLVIRLVSDSALVLFNMKENVKRELGFRVRDTGIVTFCNDFFFKKKKLRKIRDKF